MKRPKVLLFIFYNRALKLILSVYVDDPKLVGKSESIKKGWDLITGSGLVLDPPTPLGDYLGCGQFPVHVAPTEAQRRLEHLRPLIDEIEGLKEVKTGQPVKAILYDMFGFFRRCVDVYCEVTKTDKSTLRKFATPSVDDHQLKPEDFETEGFLHKDAAKGRFTKKFSEEAENMIKPCSVLISAFEQIFASQKTPSRSNELLKKQ